MAAKRPILRVDCGFEDDAEGTGSEHLLRYGPTLSVDIGFDPSYAGTKGGAVPIPRAKELPALVDTGAGESFIDTQLALALNLPVVDRGRTMAGAGGEHRTDVYLAQLRIPELEYVVYGEFCGVNLTEGGMVHRALIGRTVLREHTLTYRGETGKVTLAR
jgi:predicted aspartyl protease